MPVFARNPLLTLLGRRGRGAVVDALLQDPDRGWTVRDLARQADQHPMVAARAVQELAAVGVVEAFRPGRAMVVRLRAASAATRILAGLHLPDLRAEAARAFAAAYSAPPGTRIMAWHGPDESPEDPLVPPRVAVVLGRSGDDDMAWDAVDPALDATEAEGWPRPDVTVVTREGLEEDPIGQTILAGTLLA